MGRECEFEEVGQKEGGDKPGNEGFDCELIEHGADLRRFRIVADTGFAVDDDSRFVLDGLGEVFGFEDIESLGFRIREQGGAAGATEDAPGGILIVCFSVDFLYDAELGGFNLGCVGGVLDESGDFGGLLCQVGLGDAEEVLPERAGEGIGEVAGHDGVMVGYGDFEHDGIRQNSDLGVFEEDVFGAHFVELGAINHAGFRDDEAEDFAGHEEFGDLGARRRVFCGEDGCAAVDVCAEEENQPAGEQHDERHENRAGADGPLPTAVNA